MDVASQLPPNRLRRALASVDDAALRSGLANEFVGPGAMAAIVRHELQREEERRRSARRGRGALLPASAGAARLAAEPSLERPLASAARRGAATSDTSSSSSRSDGDGEVGRGDGGGDGDQSDDGADDDSESDEEEEDEGEEEQSLGDWLATGSGALWLADQLGECLETAGVGSLDSALRLQFRRLRRRAAAAFVSAGAGGPFCPRPPRAAAASDGGGVAAAPADGWGLLARLKRRVRARLLPAPVAGALAAVGVTPEEYFATGQPLPLPFLVEKFIQRRAKVWVRRNIRRIFVIGGAAACASTLAVSSVKAVALGMARVAPAVPLPRPRAAWSRARGLFLLVARRRGGRSMQGGDSEERPSPAPSPPPLPLFYRYEVGDALSALVDGAVAPGFLGPWVVIYVALRLIAGPDDRPAPVPAVRASAAAGAAAAGAKKGKKGRKRGRRRRAGEAAAAAAAAGPAGATAADSAAAAAAFVAAAAAPARPGSNDSDYGWV